MAETVMIREVVIRYRGTERSIALGAIAEPEHVARFVRTLVAGDAREHLVAIYLDGRNQPCAYRIVSIGTANASLVHPREVFQGAIAAGALAIIVAHNHPSGNAEPSSQDVGITDRLRQAGEIVGIPVLDHVVVAEHEYHSMRDARTVRF